MRSTSILIVLSVVVTMAAMTVAVFAGDPNIPPGPPETTNSYTLEDIYNRLAAGIAGSQSTFAEPSVGPETGTMHTINEIMAMAPTLDDTSGAATADVLTGQTFWGLTSGQWGTVAGTMPNNGAVTIMPATSQQTIALGYHNGSGFVEGDVDLIAANIVTGTTIFDVDGSAIAAIGSATDADVLNGVTYSNDSGASTGTMPDNGAVTIMPTTSQQTIALGYHDGSGYVEGDADLDAANILDGVTIFGVAGSAIEATGSASDADVLSGVTYSNDSGASTGTMPDNGSVTIIPTTTQQTIALGYHNGSGYVEGDADLVTGNIRSGVSLFGVAGDPNVVDTSSGNAVASDILSGTVAWVDGSEVTGIRAPSPVAKTGQTTSYATGDDGDLEMGVSWPSPRFTNNSDGTATDNLTGLIWLINANCTVFFAGDTAGQNNRPFYSAVIAANSLGAGYCGLTDGSSPGDWRLPNVRELQSLIDFSQYPVALPVGHPFIGVMSASDYYWTSTTLCYNPTIAWHINLINGLTQGYDKLTYWSIWPVRGGQ